MSDAAQELKYDMVKHNEYGGKIKRKIQTEDQDNKRRPR